MSDFKPTKEQLQIFKKLKEVTEPYYVYNDQMIAIAMWIDAEFEHKSKANEADTSEKVCDNWHCKDGVVMEQYGEKVYCDVCNGTGKLG